jgi:predicted dehydrogenase
MLNSEDRPRVKIAVIGVGIMGSTHVRDIVSSVPGCWLMAICDIDSNRADSIANQYQVSVYYNYQDMLNDADLDAVLIATPHYDHTPISIAAFQRGLHVLVEKPLAVHVKDGRKMISAYKKARKIKPNIQFGIDFQLRTNGLWQKIKDMLVHKDLGKLQRVTWHITDWFRPQNYYDNGGWRATWRGEGGGVLLNQCPHNLDLYQWLFGLPKRVSGIAHLGKYHNIEVEDEVTAYFEHSNGMIGHFMASTAESPGTNRLEISAELGKLVFEEGRLLLYRNQSSTIKFIKNASIPFARMDYSIEELAYPLPPNLAHAIVVERFINAIQHGDNLVVTAPEGLNSLMISNAIMLSSFESRPVELPLDENLYASHLTELINSSQVTNNRTN